MEAERERPAGSPPETWQEHWFDHRQLLQLYYSDDDCAIYLDRDVRRDEVRWLPGYIGAVWRYSKATYGRRSAPTRASTPSSTPAGTAAATPAITSAPCTTTTT